jgi:hypothetical protein
MVLGRLERTVCDLPYQLTMNRSRRPVLKIAGILSLLLLVGAFGTRAAEAQARGTLQATATVVDTRASLTALQAARSAISQAVTSERSTNTVATVAQVSVARPADRPAVVVTIDYSRN